jgi:antitoxin PrlF
MSRSRLTVKNQATVPKDIREKLGLSSGDTIEYSIEKDKVFLRKAEPLDHAFAEAIETTMPEWSSKNDEAAYNDL